MGKINDGTSRMYNLELQGLSKVMAAYADALQIQVNLRNSLLAKTDGDLHGSLSQAVTQTVDAMKKIASKIDIVDDIAYQTKLLALDAAEEMANQAERPQHRMAFFKLRQGFGNGWTETRRVVAVEKPAGQSPSAVRAATGKLGRVTNGGTAELGNGHQPHDVECDFVRFQEGSCEPLSKA